jgi:serine/threonine-protein kinase
LTFGVWHQALRDVTAHLSPKTAFMPEAVQTARNGQANKLLAHLITQRNRCFHPDGVLVPTDDEIAATMRQSKPTLLQWLSELRYLADYPLCVAINRSFFGQPSSARSYYVKRYMGVAASHREFSTESQTEMRPLHPFLTGRAGRSVLYLWPFVVCGDATEDDPFGGLFAFNQQTRARLAGIRYVSVSGRRTLDWEPPSAGTTLHWLRDERATMPGHLTLPADTLRQAHEAPPDPMVGTDVGQGRSYRLVQRLGEGAMGMVYIARGVEDRVYAIKVLKYQHDISLVRRFEREIEELQRIGQASGIIALLDWGSTNDAQGNRVPYYVMEYAERGDLASFIGQSCVPLDESDDRSVWDLEPRLAVLEQLAGALSRLHTLRLVHRDVKPSNVLLMDDGTIRLADLGLVKTLSAAGGAPMLTRMASVVGTFDYMPPEQALAMDDANPTWDIFAFGILAFELFMGRLPHRRESASSPTGTGVLQEQKALQAIPAQLRKVIVGCTGATPAGRYTDGARLAEALSTALNAVRTATLTIRAEPAAAAIFVDGVTRQAGTRLQLAAGVHVVSAVLGELTATRVVRLAPLAEVVELMVLTREQAAATRSSVAASPELIRRYLDLVQLELVTKSFGYGTTREIEDKNSHEIWRQMKREIGPAAMPPLVDALGSSDPSVRMKALQLLLHFAVDAPATVDLAAIQVRMRHESSPIILRGWIGYLRKTSDRNWPSLVEMMTHESPESGAIPPELGRLIARRDDTAPRILLAVVAVVPSIPVAATRTEAVRVLRSSPADDQAAAALVRLLQHDADYSVRAAAAYSLVAASGSSVVDALLTSLRVDVSPEVRVASARSLLAVDRERAEQAFAQFRARGDSATRLAIEEATREV